MQNPPDVRAGLGGFSMNWPEAIVVVATIAAMFGAAWLGRVAGYKDMTDERTERELIFDVAMRAVDLGFFKVNMIAVVFVETAHRHCPLRLADLLKAKDHDFAHDIGGLMKHLNTDTGAMGGFLPKFHQRKSK